MSHNQTALAPAVEWLPLASGRMCRAAAHRQQPTSNSRPFEACAVIRRTPFFSASSPETAAGQRACRGQSADMRSIQRMQTCWAALTRQHAPTMPRCAACAQLSAGQPAHPSAGLVQQGTPEPAPAAPAHPAVGDHCPAGPAGLPWPQTSRPAQSDAGDDSRGRWLDMSAPGQAAQEGLVKQAGQLPAGCGSCVLSPAAP